MVFVALHTASNVTIYLVRVSAGVISVFKTFSNSKRVDFYLVHMANECFAFSSAFRVHQGVLVLEFVDVYPEASLS